MAEAIATGAPDIPRSRLYNADLAPVPPERRTWRVGSFAALWISMSACIPTYMLASSLIGGGMNWWEAVLTIFLGNLIVLVPILLNAHAGTRYGIPFPVLCRASFGTRGANIPALLRAFVACGWFGIQSWIGGDAICRILGVFFPSFAGVAHNALGITVPQFACFMVTTSMITPPLSISARPALTVNVASSRPLVCSAPIGPECSYALPLSIVPESVFVRVGEDEERF